MRLRTVLSTMAAALLATSGCSGSSDDNGKALPDSVCGGISGAQIADALQVKRESKTYDWQVKLQEVPAPDGSVTPRCDVYYARKGEGGFVDGVTFSVVSSYDRELFWQAAQVDRLTAAGPALVGFVGERTAWLGLPDCPGQRLDDDAPGMAVSVTPIAAYQDPGMDVWRQMSGVGTRPMPVVEWATAFANHVRQVNGCTEAPLPPSAAATTPAASRPVPPGSVCGIPVAQQVIDAVKPETETVVTSAGDVVCTLSRKGETILTYAEVGWSARILLRHNALEELFRAGDPRLIGDGTDRYYPRLEIPFKDGSQALYSAQCARPTPNERLYTANALRGDWPTTTLRDALLSNAAQRDGCPPRT